MATNDPAATSKVFGNDLGRWPPDRCVALGIGRKFQAANIFATLTVAECLRVARYRPEPPSIRASYSTLHLPEAALRIVEETGLAQSLDTEARHLAHGRKQALELAMVLALEPRIVLLDEPTAGLTRVERERIGSILTSLTERERLSIGRFPFLSRSQGVREPEYESWMSSHSRK